MKTNANSRIKTKRLFKKRLNNKGAAMVSALMMVAIFSIIGTSILSIAINQIHNSAEKEIAFTSEYALTQTAECVLDVIESTSFEVSESNSADIIAKIKTNLNNVLGAEFAEDQPAFSPEFILTVNGKSLDESEREAPSYKVTVRDFNCVFVKEEASQNGVSKTFTYFVSFNAFHTGADGNETRLSTTAYLTVSFDENVFTSAIRVTDMTYGE